MSPRSAASNNEVSVRGFIGTWNTWDEGAVRGRRGTRFPEPRSEALHTDADTALTPEKQSPAAPKAKAG